MDLEEIFEVTVDGWVKVGNYATEILAEKILLLLEENLVKDLFSKEWSSDHENSIAKSIVLTLEDYYGDFEVGIANAFYFSKVVQMTLMGLMKLYMKQFVTSKPNFSDSEFFGNLDRDVVIFKEFFSKDSLQEFVSKRFVSEQIDYVENMKSLASSDVGWIPLYFDTIYNLYGAEGMDYLQKILSLRSDMTMKERSNILSQYQSKMQTENKDALESSPRAPFLSGSKGNSDYGIKKMSLVSSFWDRMKG